MVGVCYAAPTSVHRRTTLGIDEAGRGPAIGPMVIAAVALDTTAARTLTRAGLRDSKAYGATDKAREIRAQLATRVYRTAQSVFVRIVEVQEIDRRVVRNQLNILEREVAQELIEQAPAVDRIIADGKTLFEPLCQIYPHLVVYNRAEERHAAVAAASVVAKVKRDALFQQIAARYEDHFGEIRGGGYVNAATRRFLRAYAKRFRCLPPEARTSWPYPYLDEFLAQREWKQQSLV